MKEYLYQITPVRSDLMQTMTEQEEAQMSEHFHYLQNQLKEGTLVLAGPCLDGAFGVVIFRAENDEAAREFMERDPAVAYGIMTADLHPFRVSLLQS